MRILWPALLISLVACSAENSGSATAHPDAALGGSGGLGAAIGSGGVGGAGGSSTGGTGATGGAAGSVAAGGSGGGLPPGCEVLLDLPGLVHESTEAAPKAFEYIEETAPTTWMRVDVSMDVFVAAWTPKQGQYEVFTLLRADPTDHKFRWVGNAIGYVALIGPSNRQTVMVANLNLPYAAAPDGRRITKAYKYTPPNSYHFDYTYDVTKDLRQVTVSLAGNVVTQVTGQVSVPPATPPVTSIEVPTPGFELLLGGQEDPSTPDASTLGWRFSNVRVIGCH